MTKLWMLKYEALPVTNFSCSGISPGKSPFGALTRFPLQSGQRCGGQKYLSGYVTLQVILRPGFNPICPGTTATDLLLALGLASESLGEVLNLI